MTAGKRPRHVLADWLVDEAAAPVPADLLSRIEATAAGRRQHPAWLAGWRSPAGGALTNDAARRWTAFAVFAVLAVLAAITLLLVGARLVRNPDLPRPRAVTIVPGSELALPRAEQAAVLLGDGRLVLASGLARSGYEGEPSFEVRDPSTGTWQKANGLATARGGLSATLLADGTVLLVGGTEYVHHPITAVSDRVDSWDPTTGVSRQLAPLHAARTSHVALRLPDGKVVVIGGVNLDRAGLSDADPEVFDPATATFAAVPLTTPGPMTVASALADGRILVLGAQSASGGPWALVFAPSSGLARAVGPPVEALGGATATLLPDGRVLIAGGTVVPDQSASSTVQVFDPATGRFAVVAHLAEPRTGQLAVGLPDGRVVIIGGRTRTTGEALQTTGTVEVVEPDMAATRVIDHLAVDRTSEATATLLEDGTVLVAGGRSRGEQVPLQTTDVVTP